MDRTPARVRWCKTCGSICELGSAVADVPEFSKDEFTDNALEQIAALEVCRARFEELRFLITESIEQFPSERLTQAGRALEVLRVILDNTGPERPGEAVAGVPATIDTPEPVDRLGEASGLVAEYLEKLREVLKRIGVTDENAAEFQISRTATNENVFSGLLLRQAIPIGYLKTTIGADGISIKLEDLPTPKVDVIDN